jgi:hypothetical protein
MDIPEAEEEARRAETSELHVPLLHFLTSH